MSGRRASTLWVAGLICTAACGGGRVSTTRDGSAADGTAGELAARDGSTGDSPAADGAAAAHFPGLADTTSGIHVGLAFDYNISNPATETGKVDYVWGSQYPGTSGVYETFYIAYDRDPGSHDISWWKANHPDWVEYRCDRTTVAYEYGDPQVPIDITNPAVMSYVQDGYVTPALTTKGYQGIAFDNPDFENAGSWTGQRCGHYDASGTWVQQFNGTAYDPAYRAAIIAWATAMHAWIHAHYPSATMSVNFSYDFNFPADSLSLFDEMDIDVDEQGFTNGNNAPPWQYTDGQWVEKATWLAQNLARGRQGLVTLNQEPVPFTCVSNAQAEWVLASYLLVKNPASFIYISGYQDYGSLWLRPEYGTAIGAPTDAMYPASGAYRRDFTGGLALVNPSSSASATVTLPAGTFHDPYGGAHSGSITLGPASGMVLVGPT